MIKMDDIFTNRQNLLKTIESCHKDSFYSSIDIICLPSFREGLSNILLEAA